MSVPVILRREAEADLVEVIGDLEYVRSGLGRRFMKRLREVIERIEWMPELYGIVSQDVRAASVRKFRYVVYYIVFADRVEILAILHGSRDESNWKSRL